MNFIALIGKEEIPLYLFKRSSETRSITFPSWTRQADASWVSLILKLSCSIIEHDIF